jgi:DNA-directed RNA polymerase subunit alpha
MIEPNFMTEQKDKTNEYTRFIISPLPQGFGQTMGNTLRRTLLSSMPGSAATYVKINDVVHGFSTITGVKESALDIILNLKTLRFKTTGEGPFEMKLVAKKGMVYGKDFSGDAEVVNKDLYIAEVTGDKAKLDITLTVEKGMGYSPSEEKEKKEFGILALDSVFSPVTKVNFSVEGARVGRKTNFDKLILDVWTDGSMTPEEALQKSSQLVSKYFNHMLVTGEISQEEKDAVIKGENERKVDKKVYQTIIDELDLPTRVVNALLREKIETIEDLLARGKEELINLKGVGRKSVDLIEKELEKLGISFEDKI